MKLVVFGASGTIGSALTNLVRERHIEVLSLSRTIEKRGFLIIDESKEWLRGIEEFQGSGENASFVFCQGLNLNDDIYELGEFPKVFSANVGFILESVSSLLTSGNLKSGSTIVIVSSVWQDYSRTRKLSYSVSKSALRGLINSLVADLSSSKIRINAVLPGVVDSKMTRENLSKAQIKNIEMQTPSGSLVTANQVAEAIVWLTSPNSSGVNGQFITIDNGWSNVRTI